MDVSDDDSEDELLKEPPSENLLYRRNWKDKLKLIILPPLYFAFMVTAGVLAFFTIDALIISYQHKVRSIQDITVDHYRTIGVSMFPEHIAHFNSCEFRYADALHPGSGNWTELRPPNHICRYTNVTFYSHMLYRNRTAMVFNGPTLVHLKQSLVLHFTVDTTNGDYSAMEYLLLGYWDQVLDKSPKEQASYLEELERTKPLFAVPAGFRTWIKMSYTIYNNEVASKNISDFSVHSDLTAYNDRRNDSEKTSSPLLVLFEWKGDTYEYVTDILSTTVWNTVGSLAGVFVALIKVGEYAQRWIRRIRRERKKKYMKAIEIEEQHRRKLDQFWQRKVDRRLNELVRKKA